MKETKIIKFSSKNNIRKSPLLQGSEVDVKEYSKGMNALTKTGTTESKPPPEDSQQTAQPVQETKPTPPPPVKESWGDDYSYQQPQQPQAQDYSNDNTQDMKFDEEPEKPSPEEGDTMTVSEARGQAELMINLYSEFVPPALADMLKKNVGKVKGVMSYNKVPASEIASIEKFLNIKNKEIEKALKFTQGQVVMLKQALSAVLERYKLKSDNPVITLIVIVASIAISQYRAVNKIIDDQYDQINELIRARQLTAPEGDEDFAARQGLFKKKVKLRQAA